MRKRISLAIVGILGFSILLFEAVDVAAKDPDYPTKPITFYIAYGAGGQTDLSTRALLHAASKYLGQPFIPVNKTGAGGAIGAMAVMNAAPDGYTLGAYVSSHVLVIPHTKESPYRDLSGFTLIMNYGKYVFSIVVRADAPWKNWNELIQWAKQHPGGVSVGTTGIRSMSPMGMALWASEQKEKVEFNYIVLKGNAEALTYVLGGHVDLLASSVDSSAVPFLKEGKLRILGYLSEEKLPGFENFPTFKELYGEVPPNLAGVWGPKGMPEYVLKKLDDAFAKAVRDPEFIKVMEGMFMPVVYMNREEINRFVPEESPKVGEKMKILRAEEAQEDKKPR